MRILVVGGTGYIGATIVRAARSVGHLVSILARSPAAVERARVLGGTPIAGDLTEPASLRDLGRDHDVLIHAAWLMGSDRAEVDRAATEALIDSARRAAGDRLVVYTSGTWTLGPTGETAAGEDAPAVDPPAAIAYRAALEAEVIAAAGGSLRTAVVRPGVVYGGREGVTGWLLDWLPKESGRPEAVVVLGDGRYRWTVVHLEDLADLYLRLIAHPDAGGVFHAVEPEAIEVRAIADALGRVSGRPVAEWAIADATARLGNLIEAMTLDQVLAARRSARVLGWYPRRPPLLETIEDVWRDHG